MRLPAALAAPLLRPEARGPYFKTRAVQGVVAVSNFQQLGVQHVGFRDMAETLCVLFFSIFCGKSRFPRLCPCKK